ncbi:MAG TPA: transcriptional repressor [bacterium]|jgi:Fur family ferric uptake transcriptional regulator
MPEANPEKSEPLEYSEERRAFEAFLRTRGLRLTRQREIIFDELYRLDDHVDTERLVALLKKKNREVSRATVYRTLDLLAEAGMARKVQIDANNIVYEAVYAGDNHDHMICTICGKIIEFYSEKIDRSQNRICKQYEFEPLRSSLIIMGTCSDCRRDGKKD